MRNKFRAYDNIGKAWLDETKVRIDGNGTIWINGSKYTDKEIIIKLFTGRKDKKSHDVYDGDIVEFKDKCGEIWFNESAGRYYIDPAQGLELDFQFVHECNIKK